MEKYKFDKGDKCKIYLEVLLKKQIKIREKVSLSIDINVYWFGYYYKKVQ